MHDRLRMDHARRSDRRRTPNSQCASITSRPLFISVAESMVIFRPIRHVGCCSASAAVTSASSDADRPRNGPPDAVRMSRRISRRLAAVQALMNGVVLAVDRQDRDAASPARRFGHDAAGHDEHFLVGERDRLADARWRRAPPRGRRCPTTRTARGRHPDATPPPRGRRVRSPTTRIGRRPDLAQPIERCAGGHRDDAAAGMRAICSASRSAFSPAARPTTSRRSGCASTTASALWPIEPVEPRIAMRFMSSNVTKHKRSELATSGP